MYFEKSDSIKEKIGTVPQAVAKQISERYIADNPAFNIELIGTYDNSFMYNSDGKFVIDFNQIYPNAKSGSYAYAFGYISANNDKFIGLSVSLMTEAHFYLNGELIAQTTVESETYKCEKDLICKVKKGKNPVFIKCKKNELGFGCAIGGRGKWEPQAFFMPFSKNLGMLGFAYSKCFDEDIYDSAETFPSIGSDSDDRWIERPIKKSTFCDDKDGYYLRISYFNGGGIVKIAANSNENYRLYIDGSELLNEKTNEREVALAYGEHYVFVSIAHKSGVDGKFDFRVMRDEMQLKCFSKINGVPGKWMVSELLKEDYPELSKSFYPELVLNGVYKACYWRSEYHNIGVRAFRTPCNFGNWSYPLGVVMCGMKRCSEIFSDTYAANYVARHMDMTVGMYGYSRWELKEYGYSFFNSMLSDVDALDYCGSFAYAALMCCDADMCKEVADFVADYIINKQERLADGIFYRQQLHTFAEMTVWADDTYMSLPFLCRYYEMTDDKSVLDEIVNQIKLFFKYLYMPDKKLMSHVYSVKHGKKTGIAWARGNGWVLYTLTEILRILPQNHSEYGAVYNLFVDLCEGFYEHYTAGELIHQIIDRNSSYEETSGTAMCVVAYARAIKNKWLTDEKYKAAAFDMWNVMCEKSIYYNGDLYGVCTGSCYSFREDYYSKELLTNINDTHGTGIVLMAAAELSQIL